MSECFWQELLVVFLLEKLMVAAEIMSWHKR